MGHFDLSRPEGLKRVYVAYGGDSELCVLSVHCWRWRESANPTASKRAQNVTPSGNMALSNSYKEEALVLPEGRDFGMGWVLLNCSLSSTCTLTENILKLGCKGASACCWGDTFGATSCVLV